MTSEYFESWMRAPDGVDYCRECGREAGSGHALGCPVVQLEQRASDAAAQTPPAIQTTTSRQPGGSARPRRALAAAEPESHDAFCLCGADGHEHGCDCDECRAYPYHYLTVIRGQR